MKNYCENLTTEYMETHQAESEEPEELKDGKVSD